MTDQNYIRDRIERAQNRADDLDVTVVDTDPVVAQIDSDHSGSIHTVVPGSLHCSCEDNTYRDGPCYHLIHLMIGDDVPTAVAEEARLALTDRLVDMQDREMELRAEIREIETEREAISNIREEMEMPDYGLGDNHGSGKPNDVPAEDVVEQLKLEDNKQDDEFRQMIEDLSED
jgi:hypothetical protein